MLKYEACCVDAAAITAMERNPLGKFSYLCSSGNLTLPRSKIISLKKVIPFTRFNISCLRRHVPLLLLIIGLLFSSALDAQSGGRKRERKPKKNGSVVLRQYKSRGHADEFAKGNSGRRGFWSRIFKKEKPSWTNRKSGSVRSNNKENRFLFRRHRTTGKQENVSTLEKQNRDREKRRRKGNETFSSKKHKRKK